MSSSYHNDHYKVVIHNWRNEGRELYRVRVVGFKSLEEIEDYKNKYNLTHAITVGIK